MKRLGMITLISLALLMLITPLSRASPQENLTIDLTIGEECGSIHNMGENLTIYLSLRGGPATVVLWVEFPDKTKRVIKKFNLTEGTYKLPFSLSNAPPGLWMLHAAAITSEGMQKSVVCSVLVLGEEDGISPKSESDRLELTGRNITLRISNLPKNATVGDESEFLVEVHNREDESRSLKISCGGEGVICIPDQVNLTAEPLSNTTLSFKIVFNSAGERSLIMTVYENSSLILSRQFSIKVYEVPAAHDGFKTDKMGREPKNLGQSRPITTESRNLTRNSTNASVEMPSTESLGKDSEHEATEITPISLVILFIASISSVIILIIKRKGNRAN